MYIGCNSRPENDGSRPQLHERHGPLVCSVEIVALFVCVCVCVCECVRARMCVDLYFISYSCFPMLGFGLMLYVSRLC